MRVTSSALVLALIALGASLARARLLEDTLTLEQDRDGWQKPWFYHDLEGPRYTVLNTTEHYETREYQSETWAVTTVDALLYTQAISIGFKRLFNYISGENEAHKKIAMTAPVATKIVPGQGPFCNSHFTVAFYVPWALQDAPIQPKNDNIQIVTFPKWTAFVYQYGGFVVEDYSLFGKAKRLHDQLEADGIEANQTNFIAASYDPPFRLQHRHNEIFLAADSANLLSVLL